MGGGAPRYQDDDAPKRRQRLSHDRPRHQMRKGRQRLRLGRPAAAVTAPAARCLCALPRASTMYAAAAPGAACALSCVRRFPPNLKPTRPFSSPAPWMPPVPSGRYQKEAGRCSNATGAPSGWSHSPGVNIRTLAHNLGRECSGYLRFIVEPPWHGAHVGCWLHSACACGLPGHDLASPSTLKILLGTPRFRPPGTTTICHG